VRNKIYSSADEAVADISDGTVIMFGGFGPGTPRNLIMALLRQGAADLTGISNRAGGGRGVTDSAIDVGQLIQARRMRKMICTITAAMKSSMVVAFDRQFEAGEIEAELVPQGTLAERIRAGGAGIGGFYTATGVGTELAEGRECRRINGRDYLLEFPLRADYALIRASRADTFGNLQYRRAQRNFNPLMARAARITVAEVDEIVPVGTIDPDHVHTSGVYVDRIVKIPAPPEGIWDAVSRPPVD